MHAPAGLSGVWAVAPRVTWVLTVVSPMISAWSASASNPLPTLTLAASALESESDIEVVGEATNGREAVALAREQRPDVVLMDIRMPELDGIEATRQLTARHHDPPTRVLILTTFDLDEYVFDALRAGASGFLLKDVAAGQLAAGVRMVAAGDALLAPALRSRA